MNPALIRMPDPPDLEGRTVLITGATGGIGQALVRSFAAAGCNIGLHYNQNHSAAVVMDQLKSRGSGRKESFDLERDSGYEDLVSAFESKIGQIHFLINNAGSAISYRDFLSYRSTIGIVPML